MKQNRKIMNEVFLLLGASALTVLGFSHAAADDIVLTDFSGGVTEINHPEGAGQFGTWYDAANNTFGSVAAGTLEGSPALVINDGGFANGTYIIFEAVVPADGTYSIELDMAVNESGSVTGFSSYQVGVAVGPDAAHRGLNPSALPGLPIVGSYSGLTTGDDSANPVQKVETASFTANAGDSILVAFGTDVTTGGWNSGSSTWSGNNVSVDNIVLKDLNGGGPTLPPFVGEIIVDDFSNGVAQANSPAGSGQYGIWYDTTDSTFGTPSADTLDGSPAMRLTDGGYGNGVYAIYDGVFPTDGVYTVEISMDVAEVGNIDGIRGLQLGVSTGANAQHRTSILPAQSIVGSYIGLSPNDDSANPTQVVVTGEFNASAGDDLLISLGTDVQSGSWGANSALWSGSYAVFDNIVVRGIEVEPPPFELILDNDDGPTVYASSGFSTSGTPGYDGGTYQFAGTGTTAEASWSGVIPEDGFYEISTIYLAGSNRGSVVTYDITTTEGTVTGTADQRNNSLSFVTLGDYELSEGPFTITLRAETSEPTGSVVIADAIRIRELDGPPPIDEPEMRIANFLVFDGLDDVGTIQNYVNDVVRKRYNAIAVHARYRGDASYIPNKLDNTFTNSEPRNTLVGNVDVLEEFVTRGQAAGLKVFAYVNTMLVTDGTDTDPRPEHVVNQHPDWTTYIYNNGNPQPHTTATEIDGIWQDPSLPEVRLYNANIVGDILANYDLDGVIIDRQRYPDTRYNRLEADYGYHPYAIEQFNNEYGKSGIPDPFDQDWWQFRRDQNTRAVTDIYSVMQAVNPDALLLSYPIGRFDDAQNFLYQDWTAWLDNEVIDVVIPQIYTGSNATFSSSAAEHLNAYTGDRFLAVAVDTFRPGNDLEGQIEIARFLGFAGQALFTHVGAGEFGYFDALAQAWVGIAPFPELPWKSEEFNCEGLDILGTENDDVLVGTACDELIIAGAGSDEVLASMGDDMIIPDEAPIDLGELSLWELIDYLFNPPSRDDIIDGGDGIDTVDYSTAETPIIVDLADGYAESKLPIFNHIGDDTITGIENIIGRSGGGDTYIGNDDNNNIYANGMDSEPKPFMLKIVVEGRGGDDFITLGGEGSGGTGSIVDGGDGNDVIHGSDGSFQEFFGGAGDDEIYAYGGSNNELSGGAGNDYLEAEGGTKFIDGGEGDDTIIGSEDNDRELIGGPGNDYIDGRGGNDNRAVFSGRVNDYTVCEQLDGTLIITDLRGIDGVDTVKNVYRLRFSNKLVKKEQWASKIPGYTTTCD